MAGRRTRRSSRSQTLLPLRTMRLSHTVSCWYCDFKTTAFNEFLFSFGRKHARFLRVWFSVGVGFSFMALIGATAILLWEFVGALYLRNVNASTGILFGLSPLVPGLRISIADAGYMIFSTLISIAVHEFGHAIAAARFSSSGFLYPASAFTIYLFALDSCTLAKNSEGIHIEYIAIFLAILFPGALVTFNYESLQSLPQFAALRVYCAGIWHNAAGCAVCGLSLFFMPLILYPAYTHGEYPMVLSVSPNSPLSGSLSYGDLIVSFDGSHVHDPQEWIEKMALMGDQTMKESDNLEDSQNVQAVSSRKGYCVPVYWIEQSKTIQPVDDWPACPNELMAFKSGPCFSSSLLKDLSTHLTHQNITGSMCLPAKDVVKLKKCGDGWKTTGTNRSSCPCSQDEICLSPIQKPGLAWVEITYSSPYSPQCLYPSRISSGNFENHKPESADCGGTFVFVGDVLSEAHSVQLTAYQPRWKSKFGLSLPCILEKMLAYAYHVSATLALLNSLPVFFLDGESIVEATLNYVSWLSPRRQRQYLRFCLFGGTLLFMFAFSKIFTAIVFS